MRKLILLCNLFAITLGALAQNDTTRYTMVNGYGFTYNRLKAKAALVMPTDTVANKLPGSLVVLNDTLYVRKANRWEPVTGGGVGIPAGGTTGQLLAKDSDTSYDVSWIDNFTTEVRETVKASTSINKGQAVYVSGADGTNVIVSKASNASEMTSSKTLGLLYQDLANNGIGYVVISGRLSGLNTSTATAGDPVWLGTNGNLLYGIANKPVAPAHMVYLGVVTRVNANNGEIFVHVQNGFEIEELHNVLITDSLNNQLLAYDSTTRLWKNRTIATVLGYTPVKTTDTASMLAPYLRDADTTAMLAPFARDTGVVHKAGTETIIGAKTFTQPIAVNTPVLGSQLRFTSTGTYGVGVQAGQLQLIVPSTTQKISLGYGTSDAFTSILDARDADIVAYRKLRALNIIQSEIDSQNWADPSAAGGTGQIFSYFPNATNNFGQGIAAVAGTKYDAWYQVGAVNGGGFRFYRGTTELMRVTDSTKIASLAGSGTRMVVTNATGVLSAQAIPAGTVTSITAGTGLTGGTITSTGTIAADTAVLSTRAWRQKGDDSLAALITARPSGTGTTNYVTKWTGTSALGNSQIFDNGTRVGIGTAAPAARLDIRGSGLQDLYFISTTGSNQENTIQSYFNNGGGWSDLSTKSQNLLFYTGPSGGPQAERMRIASGGNVGIGTASPSLENNTAITELTVTKSGNVPANIAAINLQGDRTLDAGNTSRVGTINFWQTTNNIARINALRGGADNSGALDFLTNSAGGGLTSRLYIHPNGRVGVNTTTDAGYQFDIAGNLRTTTGANFATTSGAVGIGKTTPQTNSKLDVEGNVYVSDGSFVHFRNSIVTPGSYGIHYSGTSPRFPLRIVGNSDPVTQRFIEFGHYKNDNKDSTWNPQVLINSYNGNTGIGGQNPTYGKLQIYSSTPTQVGISLYTGLETAERTTYAANEGLQLSSYQSTNGSPNTKTSDIVANADGTVPSNMRFWTKPSGATSPNERLRITSDGNIGIGITTPSERLDVNGRARIRSIDSTASAMNVLYADATGVIKKASATAFPGGSGTTNYIPKWTAANTLGNSQIFDNGGGVGIGTASPGQKLEIYDGALLINRPSLPNDANNTMYRTQAGADATLGGLYFTMNARPSATGSNRYVEMFAGDNVAYRNIIFPYANVGIGTTSPSSRLQVQGFQQDAAQTITRFAANNASGQIKALDVQINAGSNLAVFNTAYAGSSMGIDFADAGTSRMRILSNGRVGINTGATDAGFQFDVNGSIRGQSDAVFATGAGNLFVGAATPAISNGLKYIYNEVGNASGIGPELILHNTSAADAASMAVSFTGVRSGAGVASQIRSTRRGILTFLTQDLPSATPNTPTERMRIDAVGNVGIGTQSNIGRFDVVGSAVGAGIFSVNTDATRVDIQSYNKPLAINRQGNNTLLNEGGGNVGIGTASPADRLGVVVNTDAASGMNISNQSTGSSARTRIALETQGGNWFLDGIRTGGEFAITRGSTEAVRINGSGNVGIGTTTPTAGKLQIANLTSATMNNGLILTAADLAGANNGQRIGLTWGTNTTVRASIGMAFENLLNNSNAYMTFGTGSDNTERMRIFSNGRIFMGASPTDAGYQLDVNGNTRVTGKIDVTANASIGHNVIRTGTSDIAAQIFNSNGWLLYGAEGANGGAIFTGSTPYAAVVGSGYNRPLQIATNNTVRMEIDSVGLVGINTVTPTERLDVNGRARIRTVDSTATATNMLYVDNNGVIKKTAVPGTSVTYSTDVASIASGSGFTFVKDSATGTNHHFLNKIEDVNTGDATVTMQIAVYKTTSTFTTGAWQSVATIPGLYAPQTTVIYELPGYASGTTYYTSGSAQFSGAAEYTGTKVVRIDPSGNVEVRIGTVSASATQGGTNYVIIPIAVTWVVNPTPL